MLRKEMQDKIDAFQEAKDNFEQEILDEMERIAISMNLDEMKFMHYGNCYIRNGREVKSKRLEELDHVYCDYVHRNGFEAVWLKGRGW